MTKMKCINCNSLKEDTDVFWGQDCNECRDNIGIAHGCYSPQIDFSKVNGTHALFANIIRPHHFLRKGTLCEIVYWDGGLTGAYIRNAISKGGRVVGSSCGLWVRLKYLGNYRVKWSYNLNKGKERK